MGIGGSSTGFTTSIIENNGSVLESKGTSDDWVFPVRVDDSDQLSDRYQSRVDGMNVDLSSIHGPLNTASPGKWDLTEEQRRTAKIALENGYAEIPRSITLVELGNRTRPFPIGSHAVRPP